MIMLTKPNYGAFVVSLDFEMYWGVRDFIMTNDHYKKNLVGEREAISALLDLFEEFRIAATWATVGFLFADSGRKLKEFMPRVLPKYRNSSLSPYNEACEGFIDESIKGAPEMIELIRKSPRQEVGTHTFSHYYCLEEGQNAESFSADIESAVAIARASGVELRSIVFPRNQYNPNYDEILVRNGIICFRGNQLSRMYNFNSDVQHNPFYRMTRLADSYVNVSGLNTYAWERAHRGRLADVAASMFLRPVTRENSFLNELQFRRIVKSLEYAARAKEIFHLWWHPHNFGVNLEENIFFLRRIFERFHEMRVKHDMRSLSMAETAACVLATDSAVGQ